MKENENKEILIVDSLLYIILRNQSYNQFNIFLRIMVKYNKAHKFRYVSLLTIKCRRIKDEAWRKSSTLPKYQLVITDIDDSDITSWIKIMRENTRYVPQ